MEVQIHTLSELLIHVNRYHEYKALYQNYLSGKCPDKFINEHYGEILLYETAVHHIKANSSATPPYNPTQIRKQLEQIESDKCETIKQLNFQKERHKNLEMVNKNVSLLFTDEQSKKCLPLIR